jgi:hypothetical protein
LNVTGEHILDSLRQVAAERAARAAQPGLGERLVLVKAFQHARFAKSYSDLLANPRYAGAARFFLDDLYGPLDFSERDEQFQRIVPSLTRLFPQDIVDTVSDLAALHALSEKLDSAMARALTSSELTEVQYAAAWRKVGQPEARDRQIRLMVSVGLALERYTNRALVRQSLRLMRGPARAAGLGVLQQFLERGFDTFRAMHGAEEFLALIFQREQAISSNLFGLNGG